MEKNELYARARRAYELGRAKVASKAMGAAAVLALAAVTLGRSPAQIGALAFRGRAAGRAVWPGLLAGGVAMLLPLGVVMGGDAWLGIDCMRFCVPACVVGGALTGAAIASLAARQDSGESEFLLGGIAVAALTASLGCGLAGGAGLVGMAIGAVVGGAPVLVAAHARR
ncbi:MAG: hypothetical protein E6J85_09110 [Deltaproteobacteria bacterium]|nr:MAG: hypothetical protein E6J85_09110 [Deltaproteobacteria bacterium]